MRGIVYDTTFKKQGTKMPIANVVAKKVEPEEYVKLKEIFGKNIATSIYKWSTIYEVDPYLIASLIVAENSGLNDTDRVKKVGDNLKKNPNYYGRVKSEGRTKAYGLMQLTELTFNEIRRIAKKATVGDEFKKVISDYDKSIKYAAIYLSHMKRKYKYENIEDLVVAYNAGPFSSLLKNPDKANRAESIKSKVAKEYLKKFNEAYNQIANTQDRTKEALLSPPVKVSKNLSF